MANDGGQQNGQEDSVLAEIVYYLVAGYGVVVFVFWLVQWLLSEQVSFIGMIKSTLHLLLIPSLVLLPLTLLVRQWRLALFVTPVVIAFAISYGIFFVPRGNQAPAGVPELRIMTFNIQAPDEGEVASLVAIIQEADPDVVAIQELSPAAADGFAQALQDRYPHQAFHTADHVYAGQGFLSRYPILADDYWRPGQGRWTLGDQRVVLDLDGVPVVFYNAHPIPPLSSAGFHAEQHTEALRDVLARARSETAPTVILGDFNMTDQFHEYRLIADSFDDAYKAVGAIGLGFTYPHDKWTGVPPLVRLDYIFYSPDWLGLTADVWPESGSSDHAPLLAQLTLP